MRDQYRTQKRVRPEHDTAPADAGCGCPDQAGVPARLFLCGRCRAQVLICSHCDRGQMYCLEGCARKARLLAQRQAGRRYQTSRRGRLNHAARSRRYRARKNNVTHQGSPPDLTDDLLLAGSAVAVTDQTMTDRSVRPRWQCHCCGRLCPEFVRRDFLRRRQGPRNNRRGRRSDHSRGNRGADSALLPR